MSDAHRITDVEHAKTFVFAGKSIFTLRSQKTGNHLTLRVKKPKDTSKEQGGWEPPFFVSVLDHADGQGGYSYLGTLNRGRFSVTRKSPYYANTGALQVTVAGWFFSRLANNILPDNMELWHEGKCGRCGRRLTHPDSIATGLGPECAGKI